jgi:hypothetical protein
LNLSKKDAHDKLMSEVHSINGAAYDRMKTGFFSRLFGRKSTEIPYTDAERNRRNYLLKQVKSLGHHDYIKPPDDSLILSYQNIINKTKIILEKRKKEEGKRGIEKAIIASAKGKTRDAANSIKRELRKQAKEFHKCPYCNEDIGKNPHCDHIYPVSHGGLSTLHNMVYICSSCNLKKKDYTLREFISINGLNRDEIERNLLMMGKRI